MWNCGPSFESDGYLDIYFANGAEAFGLALGRGGAVFGLEADAGCGGDLFEGDGGDGRGGGEDEDGSAEAKGRELHFGQSKSIIIPSSAIPFLPSLGKPVLRAI